MAQGTPRFKVILSVAPVSTCLFITTFEHFFFFFFFSLFLFSVLTGIHTFSDLRGAQDRAWRGVNYAVGCEVPRSKQTMRLKKKPHA